MLPTADMVEPVPRRVRAVVAGQVIVDTTAALYVFEKPNYPYFYLPLGDVMPGVLIDEDHPEVRKRGTARRHTLKVGDVEKPSAARVYGDDAINGIAGHVKIEWEAVDEWYEEDEQVFVHPRNPYTRVDALRSRRLVRVELEGVVLAESASTVMVYETGLPTRYYFERTAVHFKHLVASDEVTSCPYKGNTSQYWHVTVGETVHENLVWAYDFPTRQLLPIAGLMSFYNEKVDVFIDGQPVVRPVTHFFS